jgi:hypothetical protein
VEERVLAVRQALQATSDLGEYGAGPIRQALAAQGFTPLPAVRTIGRILERRGVLDGRRRQRWPAPPRGWYLPTVAAGQAELDSFDLIEGLVIRGGIEVEVLTAVGLHSGIPAAWPSGPWTARQVSAQLVTHWQHVGLPAYAQFDNDTRFQGPHQHPDTLGRVIRLCLSLEVTPVFAPPREMGFQAALENFNGRWQAKVWTRFQHDSLTGLQEQSARFIAASRRKLATRLEQAPSRRPWPVTWRFDPQAPLRGCVMFLRRTNEEGVVSLLGRMLPVDSTWPHRLVRAEVDLTAHVIRVVALRRRDPLHQPLLREIPYRFPHRPFRL